MLSIVIIAELFDEDLQVLPQNLTSKYLKQAVFSPDETIPLQKKVKKSWTSLCCFHIKLKSKFTTSSKSLMSPTESAWHQSR